MDMKIIILPGLDGHPALRDAFIAALALDFDADCFHYPRDRSDYQNMLLWVREKLQTVDGNYILIAESFSGPLAHLLATDPPPGLRGIVWVGSFITPPRRLPAFIAHLAKFIPLSAPGFRHSLIWVGFGRWGNTSARKDLLTILKTLPKHIIVKRLQQVLRYRPDLDRKYSTGLKLFAISAQYDSLLSRRTRKGFRHQNIPLCILPGPHFLLQAMPVEVACEIRKFCARL